MTDADTKIAELRALVDREVVPLIQWYQRKKRWPRRLHRLSGVLVIALGATIPLLSAYSDAQPTRIAIGIAGAVITVITGLATVYEWQKKWRLFTVAQSQLEAERLTWELALTRATADPDPDTRLHTALTATEVLLERTALTRHSETTDFFAGQSDPARAPVIPA